MMIPLMTLVFSVVLFSAMQGCDRPAAVSAAVKAEGGKRGELIVAAGDSLSAGFGVAEEDNYPSQLDKRLQAAGVRYRLVNAGVSGETSSGLLSRLDWLLTLKPAIVILETGANDGLRALAPALIKENLRRIISRLQGRGITVVLVGMRMVVNLGPEYADAFRRIYPELAQEFGLLFVPFLLEGVATDPALQIEDGIHPNREGYRIVVDTLYPYVLQAIDRHLQKLAPPGASPGAAGKGGAGR